MEETFGRTWEVNFKGLIKKFVDGKYLTALLKTDVKHMSVFIDGYSMYIATNGESVRFDVCTLLDFQTIMKLTYKDGKVIEGIGPYEDFINDAISIITLSNLEVI